MRIEDIIEDVKSKRPNDSEFMSLYREWKINIAEGKDQGETLANIIIYFHKNNFLNVWGEDMEQMMGRSSRTRPKSPYLD